jgi:hypothetical protein
MVYKNELICILSERFMLMEVIVHTYNLNTWEDGEFEVSQNYKENSRPA